MGVEHVGPPIGCQRNNRIGQQIDLAPFTQPHRAAGRSARAVKGDPVGFLGIGAILEMTQPGDPAHFEPHRSLRFQNRPGAKGVAAVQRQGVVKDVKNAGHGPIF